jgi:hypothetical protein
VICLDTGNSIALEETPDQTLELLTHCALGRPLLGARETSAYSEGVYGELLLPTR